MRLTAAVVLAVTATGLGGGRAVVATPANEEGPAASGAWLAWMRSAQPNHLPPRSTADVLLRHAGRTVRVNPAGSHAQTGGFAGGALVLEIAQGGRSRLARYDLARRRLRYLPSFVNDGAWLWRPDADGHRVLYGATVPGTKAVLRYEIRLADLDRRSVRVLASLDGHAEYAAPGQLRGDWATWVACPESTCEVWRENVTTGRTEHAPAPDHLVYTELGPTVDTHGVVYYGRMLATCGRGEVRRWDGRHDTLVRRLPSNTAFQYAYLDGRTLYFDLGPCSWSATADIRALDVP